MNKVYSLVLLALLFVCVYPKADEDATEPVRIKGLYAWYSNLCMSMLTMGIYISCALYGSVTSFLSNDGGYLTYYCFNQFLGSITSDTWLVKF
jgi:hypothetical protein